MRLSVLCAGLVAAGWLAGRATACDVTDWPSTTHHPSPVKMLPAAELLVTYRLSHPVIEEYVQVVRKAIRTAAGDAAATVEIADRGQMLAIHLARPPEDWTLLDDAARTAAPAATRQDITVSIRLRPDAVDQAFRQVAQTAAVLLGSGGSCRLDPRGGLAVVTFPADRPPVAAAVWRLRKAALSGPAAGGGTS